MGSTGDLKRFDISLPDPKARIQEWIDTYRNDPSYKGFEAPIMNHVRVVSARPAQASREGMEAYAEFEIVVAPALCNPMGNMHGGAVATLADMTTTMTTAAIARKDFWDFSGVSRTLGVTYINPALRGTTVVVECTLRSAGKRLCEFENFFGSGITAGFAELTIRYLHSPSTAKQLWLLKKEGKSRRANFDSVTSGNTS